MEIFKIKNVFSKLSLDKISGIHNAMNKSSQKGKLKINMITKSPFRKQIIILMGSNNVEKVIVQSYMCIANINRQFKDIKSETSVDFIYSDDKKIVVTTDKKIVVTTNKIAVSSDLNIMEKYIKKLNNVDSSNIMSPRLPQSKFYLKILGISYLVDDINILVTPDIIE